MDAQYSGVPEYTYNLVKKILKLDSENEYRLFYSSLREARGPMRALTRICPVKFRQNVELRSKFHGASAKIVWLKWPNKILNYFLFKILNRPKIDKFLGVDVFWMPHINFIGLSGAARSVLTVHDLSFLRYPQFFSSRKNFWHKMVNIKKLAKRFDKIVAVSENTKKDIVELCGIEEERVKVIYSGIGEEYRKISNSKFQISNKIQNSKFQNGDNFSELEKMKKKYNLPNKFILFLGTLEPRKNVEGLIAAYDELRNNNKDLSEYKLVVAGGKGWKSESIFYAWQNSPFKDDIIFLGYIKKEDKPYLYNLASLFVYPSFYEGFGFPPLEAMACGAPVVTSAYSSLPEIVGEAALMIDPYNISDIALAMEKVLADERLRNNLAENGLKIAAEFNWEKTAEEYLEVFRNLV